VDRVGERLRLVLVARADKQVPPAAHRRVALRLQPPGEREGVLVRRQVDADLPGSQPGRIRDAAIDGDVAGRAVPVLARRQREPGLIRYRVSGVDPAVDGRIPEVGHRSGAQAVRGQHGADYLSRRRGTVAGAGAEVEMQVGDRDRDPRVKPLPDLGFDLTP
jgi:hypothetical protein